MMPHAVFILSSTWLMLRLINRGFLIHNGYEQRRRSFFASKANSSLKDMISFHLNAKSISNTQRLGMTRLGNKTIKKNKIIGWHA